MTGVSVLDAGGRRHVLAARAVLLATGGLGQLYSSTTNPGPATGDGLALGLRAGAVAADLEFVQFHPTVLWDGPAVGRRALVTEAVRGEGAVLVDAAGRRFMLGVHPLAELAPRDVVAGAITRELAASGAPCVFLDARGLDGFAARFPTVFAACTAVGIDPRREPIPVTPAAHYACGGLVTDPYGRTSVAGLYAAGEVARTGLHGANRLASNSLLEAMVVGARVAPAVQADRREGRLAADADLADLGRPVRCEVGTGASGGAALRGPVVDDPLGRRGTHGRRSGRGIGRDRDPHRGTTAGGPRRARGRRADARGPVRTGRCRYPARVARLSRPPGFPRPR